MLAVFGWPCSTLTMFIFILANVQDREIQLACFAVDPAKLNAVWLVLLGASSKTSRPIVLTSLDKDFASLNGEASSPLFA